MHNDFNSDTIAGMAEAQQRHGGGGMLPAQIEQQYTEIQARRVSPAVQYVPQQEQAQQVQVSVSPVLIKAVGGAVLLVIAGKITVAFVAAAFIWIESHALACGAAFAAFVTFLSFRGSGGESVETTACGVKPKVTVETTVITKTTVY